MFGLLYPHEYVEDVFSIDYQKVYDLGYRAIIFDIDQTLVQHGEDSTPEIDQLFQEIQQIGLKTFLLSNNSTERIDSFLKNIQQTAYIPIADKPNPRNYKKAVEMLDVKKEEVLFIGDQLFTDILGANRSGLDNVLVRFLRHEHEINIGKKRQVEALILHCYQRSRRYQHRLGDICKEKN